LAWDHPRVRPLEIAGLVLLMAVIAVGVTIAVLSATKFPRAVLEETSTSVPGSRELRLDERRYNVFYDGTSADEPIPRLRVQVVPVGGGAALPLEDFGGNLMLGDAQAIASVEVPRTGPYRIVTAGGASSSVEPRVVLGEPIGGRLLRVVLGGALAFLGFVGSILLVVISLLRRRRRA
jgi:hypothetical protein